MLEEDARHEVFRLIDNPLRSEARGERASISMGDDLIDQADNST